MPNPYFFSGKITNPNFFVGRETELKKIFGYLDTTHTEQIQHVSVIGARRIGKSSLLYHVYQNPRKYLSSYNKYRFAFIDLDSPQCHTLKGLLGRTLQLLDLRKPRNISLENFYETLEKMREQEKIWPVLILDEFEHLTYRNAEFKDSFYESMRSLGSNNIAGIITASQSPLQKLAVDRKLTSPFYNIFHQLELKELTHTEVQILLKKQDDLPFTRDECVEIIKIAGNHPARLQVVASLLYETKARMEPVDWKKIKIEVLREPPFVGHVEYSINIKNGLVRGVKWLLWDTPQFIGHAIMVFIGRGEHTNEVTDRIFGYITYLTIFSLIIGFIPYSLVTKYINRLSELFFKN